MSDKEYKELQMRVYRAAVKHRRLLLDLEMEYLIRYGNIPSDVDDNCFVDCFSNGEIAPDLKVLHEAALESNQ